MPNPWEDVDTELAAAFRAAMGRIEAMSHGDTETLGITPETRGLLWTGLDLDPSEVVGYTEATAVAYVRQIDEAGAGVVKRADAAAQRRGYEKANRDDYVYELRQVATLLMRGMGQTMFLAGALYGQTHEQRRGTGKPLPEGEQQLAGIELVRTAFGTMRAPSDEQRRELARDAVQAVLDLEADRLDRAAPTLEVLGLVDVAQLMRAAAALLRGALELPPPDDGEQ